DYYCSSYADYNTSLF
nr:immunoglobulin light chain junction region [Macaca mulatta]MOX69451.1 immunoglobulin light chain junction region [Macaca mulatta]MOX69956.1 immunoglobulin light chain junction region [Macaca mulatta]MOX69990.1 immunoglobulin light chain junction region [Macaca mulatta]MOX71716.1 immunoglobulin light chain junction region [Macaca mulatta]